MKSSPTIIFEGLLCLFSGEYFLLLPDSEEQMVPLPVGLAMVLRRKRFFDKELKVAVNQPPPYHKITNHFLILLVPFSQLIYFTALFKMLIEKGTS